MPCALTVYAGAHAGSLLPASASATRSCAVRERSRVSSNRTRAVGTVAAPAAGVTSTSASRWPTITSSAVAGDGDTAMSPSASWRRSSRARTPSASAAGPVTATRATSLSVRFTRVAITCAVASDTSG